VNKKILFYEGPWYVFSNFSSFAVLWRGRLWMTSEHAYQAAKFFDKEIIEKIFHARSAHDAKKIARKYKEFIRSDWEEVKLAIMTDIVREKLLQHPYIQQKIVESYGCEIIEDSPTDSFWGRGPNGDGENHLGKIWMKFRGEFEKPLL